MRRPLAPGLLGIAAAGWIGAFGALTPIATPASSDGESAVTTAHEIRLAGARLRYTAEAGRIALMDSARGAPRGAIFYVAYRVAARAPRPVCFVWNGGPGANSLRLHLQGLGPRRIEGSEMVDNQATLLGVTDLVFMDPVGTGFSRAATPADEPGFYSTLGDFEATAEFVTRWRAGHHATAVPLSLAGESFGSWRAAAVAERLGSRGVAVAGIILISGGCPVGPLQPPEVRTALRVPAWALTALHHHALDPALGHDRDSVAAAASRWASERYASALARIASLGDAERDTIVQELARHIGLGPDQVNRATLTVTPRAYRESLLAQRGLTLNTFDMRLTGATPPLPAGPIGHYLREELGYHTTLAYRDLEPDPSAGSAAPSVNQRWNYDSGPATAADMTAAAAGEGPPGAQPWVLGALALHPDLRVFVAAGRYDSFGRCWANDDLATRLPAEVAGRFTFRCYESGHMIGADPAARASLADDLRAFLAGTPNTVRPGPR